MQDVQLKTIRVIDGAVRHPAEGAITVSDEEFDRLVEADAIVTEEDGDDPLDEDGLDEKTMVDLNLLVTKEGVSLHGATRKADVIAAIRNHRAERAPA